MYQIQVKYTLDGRWYTVYTGQWNTKARMVYAEGPGIQKRVVEAPSSATSAGVAQVFNEHPGLGLLDAHLDEFYTVPGDAGEQPNRIADPQILSAVRRRAFPFDDVA